MEINGDLCHELLIKNRKRKLAFNLDNDYIKWKVEVRKKFIELVGIENIKENACPIKVEIEEEVDLDGYKRIRFVFESEVGSFVPCYLLVPSGEVKKRPVAITLQGHSTGFHNSVGIAKFEGDEAYIERGNFAVQAVKQGFVALAIEQRGMGERKTNVNKLDPCGYHSIMAMELGRTVIGERIWDVSRAIDALSCFDKYCDLDKILITGNSGGGTLSFYATCLDERIKLAVPSCGFCSFESSIMAMGHCACNFIPNILKYFEMGDLTCLVADRPLAIVTGSKDVWFPLDGVEKSFQTVKAIYEKEDALDKCRLVITDMGHWWCKDVIWKTINEEVNKLGWEV
ncbi:MAG: hypothetical protein E7358_01625 [Clostridiales bacterium]|nr:hypothetical protein [Clostridiales bacterium]